MKASYSLQDLDSHLRDRIMRELSEGQRRSLASTSKAWRETNQIGRSRDRALQNSRAEELLDAFIYKCNNAVKINRADGDFHLVSDIRHYPNIHNLPVPGGWYRNYLLRRAAKQYRKLMSSVSGGNNESWQKKLKVAVASANIKPFLTLGSDLVGIAMMTVGFGWSLRANWHVSMLEKDLGVEKGLVSEGRYDQNAAVALGVAGAGAVVATLVKDKLEALCDHLHKSTLEPFVARIAEQEKCLKISLRKPDFNLLEEAYSELDQSLRGAPVLGVEIEGKTNKAREVWLHIARIYGLQDVPRELKYLRLGSGPTG